MADKKPRCNIKIHIEGKAVISFDFESSDDLKLLEVITTKMIKEIIAPNYPAAIYTPPKNKKP